MKLQEYRDEFLFDEFPKVFNPTQKVFFTHLHDLETLQLPACKLPVIHTSKTLAARIKYHFNSKGTKVFSTKSFVFLPKRFRVYLSDGKPVKLNIYEENAPSRNLMILLQKEGKVTHFYAGICTQIRGMFNVLATCMQNGTERLYMDLRRANEDCDEREMNNVIDRIEDLLLSIQIKIKLIIPKFGYENLIAKLAYQLRARVHLNHTFRKLYGNVLNLAHFQQDVQKAKIYVLYERCEEDYISSCSDTSRLLTIRLTSSKPVKPAEPNCYEMQYCSLPTKFDLKLLAAVVKPDHIFGITHRHMNPPQLPRNLRALCRIPGGSNLPKSMISQGAKPMPKTDTNPSKHLWEVYRIHKPQLDYLDDDDEGPN